MLPEGGVILIFLIVGVVFGAGGLAASFLIHPRRKNAVKEEPYECGPPTQGPTWVRFRAQYFVYALLFVIFDVETIYLYPWAVKFNSLGLFAFIEMIIFLFILVVGLWYAWKKGALEWR
ncbi:NADH-quinone oxidoreductase subunit A [Desulfohalotomaculum tongense]|uniref:NADH-quinone oxidoreductase subunit A n=1 Tax=Desulforadius tongensis TaxID=1216062 RepID=UPI00195C5439|nr:NADH-quinone oxidoreductase subunit A [Desulforadius tongensis]MBM7854366.1 NADH-quinone oxidoreductase subunit A [Desulforadius tongensis]